MKANPEFTKMHYNMIMEKIKDEKEKAAAQRAETVQTAEAAQSEQ